MSPILDDRGRLLGRVNIIDLLVVVVLVVLVVFAFLRFSGGGGEVVRVETTYVVERVRDATKATFEQLEAGTEVRDETGTLMGTLKGVSAVPTPVEVPTAEGTLEEDESPLYYDVTLVLAGEGIKSPSSGVIRIGPVPLLVGKVVVLSGPTFEVRGQIRGVREAEGA